MAGRGGPSRHGSEDPPPVVTPQIAAEAATWVARLHGPSRSRAMELQCLKWQAQSAAHRHAFERCTDTWMEVPNAARSGAVPRTPLKGTDGQALWEGEEEAGSTGRRAGRRAGLLALGAAFLAVAVLMFWQPASDDLAYVTGVGESQTVVLEDGTRMSLNTSTQVRVHLDASQRLVHLDSGEAEFDVAKDASRPFVVRAAAGEVMAIGTVFSVRLMAPGANAAATLAVTLIEGQVSVRPAADAGAALPAQPLLLRPGERALLGPRPGSAVPAAPRVDRPPLEQVMAWKRNEAVFDQVTLSEAVAEMNRYSRTPLVLLGPLAGEQWRVSGRFRTGDNRAFASALASLHGLVVHEREGRLELSPGP